jgi:hypothetical protein
MELFLIWIVCPFGAAHIAYSKGNNAFIGFFVGAVLGPFGLLFTIVEPVNEKTLEERDVKSGYKKRCPYCREVVKPGAIICKHCHKDLMVAPDENSWEQKKTESAFSNLD